MITKISFENYKSFKEKQTLELRPMTILIGKNSSGKSAVLKMLPMIENALNADFDEPLLVDNYGIELGVSFKDLIFGRKQVGYLMFELKTNDGNCLTVKIQSGTRHTDAPKITYWKWNDEMELEYNDRRKNYLDKVDETLYNCFFYGFTLDLLLYADKEGSGNTPQINYHEMLRTNYFSAYRKIPNRIFNLKPAFLKNKKWEIDGENAYSFLIQDVTRGEGTLLKAVSQWYEANFEDWGLRINVEQAPDYKVELVRSHPKVQVNIRDVGQGMSQILPLVVDAFLPAPKEKRIITIIEEPELHLHPAAHANLAELFADNVKNKKTNYLIETHSRNFVLRMRRLVAEGKFDKDDLMIYYVDFDEETGESNLKPIHVDKDGKVDFWPENVFNETSDETTAIRIAQLNRQKKML
jgi:hypothetical protein